MKPLSLSLAIPGSAPNQQNRFNSPLASPAATLVHANTPSSANDRRTSSFGGLGAALKKSTSFKTRPPSDSSLPPRSAGLQGQPRSKSMAPLSRGSTRPSTPSGASTPTSASQHPSTLSGLEESYVTKVGMRMLDAVNKTFAPSELGSVGGRPVPSWRRAKELGQLIETELRAAQHDPYFFRTMLRSTVLKTLTLFLTRISALMTTTPSFSFPLPTPMPTGLQFTLNVARCAVELRDSLRECRGLCGDHSTLQGWEQKLDDVVIRLVSPIIASIKAEVSSVSIKAHEPASQTPPAPTKSLMSRSHAHHAPVAPWLKQLSSIFEGTNRILAEGGEEGFKWRVQIATIAIWKVSLNLAARDVSTMTAAATAPASKGFGLKAMSKVASSGKKSPSPPASPPLDPAVNAPPSPPLSICQKSEANSKLISEAVAFEKVVQSFVAPLQLKTPQPTKQDILNPACECALCQTGRAFDFDSAANEDDLAKAAMLEALGSLSALIVVLTASHDFALLESALDSQQASMTPWTPSDVLSGAAVAPRPSKACPTVASALKALPDLLLAHVVLARMRSTNSNSTIRMPHVLCGLDWSSYVDELKGFRTAEEWTPEIFDDVREELDRVAAERSAGDSAKEHDDERLLRKVLAA